jgi:hypothetical protein
MPPHEYLADQLWSAYDCYLAIQQEIAEMVKQVLNRTANDETSALLCPPCFYHVNNEPRLVPSMLAAMDGNNSLKSVDPSYQHGKERFDDRVILSPRWIETDAVDQYKDEVTRSATTAQVQCE